MPTPSTGVEVVVEGARGVGGRVAGEARERMVARGPGAGSATHDAASQQQRTTAGGGAADAPATITVGEGIII